MKKIYIIALAALAASLFAVSCNKEQNAPDEPQVVETEQVTITATIPADLSKVAMDYSGDALELTWSVGDKIIVADHSNPSGNKQEFTLSSGEGTKSATFTGTAVSASSYDISLTSNWPANILAQSQPSDGSTAGLGYMVTLTNVNTYEDVSFSSSWATSKGGTFAQSGALHVQISLPSDVAETVNLVTMSADKNIFGSTGTMTVTLASQEDNGDPDVLDVYATIPPTGVSIPSGTGLLFKFGSTNPSHSVYTRYYKTSSVLNLAAGQLSKIYLTGTDIDKFAGKDDDGTAEHPYLIADKYQMLAMGARLVADETKYFTFVDDIDLSEETWTPLNNASSYNKGIYVDGQNHTIKNMTVGSVAYSSFAGVLKGTVKNIIFDGANITAGGNTAGVVAGYIGSGTTIVGSISGITVKNSTVSGTKQRLGGIAGYVKLITGDITDCHVINTTVSSTADRVGGLFGPVDGGFLVEDCSATSVTVSGTINIGGLIGVGYCNASNCTSSGAISSTNTTADADIALGGLIGYFEGASYSVSDCSSSVIINQTTNGRDIGGLIGKMLAGTIEKSYSTGNVSGIQRNVGGLIGLISLTSGTATVRNCYSTGNVSANSYNGGFLGLHEKGTASIENCYASGNVTASAFAAGGFIGVAGAGTITVSNSAAWNGSVTPGSYGSGNWSSGAVVGVTYPTCTLTDNYRSPDMLLTAYWVPAADYDHPNVSSTHPLVKQDGTETTATSTSKGQDGYPQFPYHGKHCTGTLSALAEGTLGWSSSIWDFSADLPTLK